MPVDPTPPPFPPLPPYPPCPDPTPIPIRLLRDWSPPASKAPSESEYVEKDDDFYRYWDAFCASTPQRANTTNHQARLLAASKSAAAPGSADDGLATHEFATTSYESARASCCAKVAAIVDECQRLNQKYRDALFDLEGHGDDCLGSLSGNTPSCTKMIGQPPGTKRVPDIFEKPKFFSEKTSACADDVVQGNAGDCWFLAALMSVSAKPELLQRLCVARDETIGVYGFVFYRDGEWISEVVDDRLFLRVGDEDKLLVVKGGGTADPMIGSGSAASINVKHDMEKLRETLQKGGEALYFARCRSNETWLPLIEKAYAKAHGDYKAIEGGWVSEAIEDLTGGVAVTLNPEDIMCKDRFWKTLLSVNKDYLFGGGSKILESHGMLGGHAYTVLEVFEEDPLRLLKIKNPWGEKEFNGAWSDWSEQWTPQMMQKLNHKFGDDGVFWMSYEDFLKHFPTINRTRLFGPEWTITQQWTCVNVPWTVDYLDTSFALTITQPGPVCIVLCQPDERFFLGLRGRYCYSLHFRVYRSGDEQTSGRYLVRSMHNSGGETSYTRSVSVDLDLEPGSYSVLVKVTPWRDASAGTAADRIRAYCVERKEKLLWIGRSFDHAHSKGKRREKELENHRTSIREARARRRREEKRKRMVRRLERERERKREERIRNALLARHKAADVRRAEALIRVSRTDAGLHSPTTKSEGQVDNRSSDASAVLVENGLSSMSLSSSSPQQAPVNDQSGADMFSGDETRELKDDDFEWDSEIDGSVELTSEDELEDLHEKDPWNALCVLGLRVYSMAPDCRIDVVVPGPGGDK